MKNILQDIIKRAIDIHVHIGPEVIPRKYTVGSLIDSERDKIAGMVLKNHFYATTPFIKEVEVRNVKLFGGIVLNNAVGGLNPEAVYAASLLSENPIIVWFPTINAEQFLLNSKYEIAPEWVQKKNFVAREASSVSPVVVTKNNKLVPKVLEILSMIKQTNSVLATGHISWKESELVIKKALEIGVKKIVITHPIYQRISMPIRIQQKLAEIDCFMEQSYSMYSIDKIPIAKIAKQIREVGYESVILSSDVGQTFSPSPSDALYSFLSLLLQEGFGFNELERMAVTNPRKLLGIEQGKGI